MHWKPNFPSLELITRRPREPVSSLEVSGVCRSGKSGARHAGSRPVTGLPSGQIQKSRIFSPRGFQSHGGLRRLETPSDGRTRVEGEASSLSTPALAGAHVTLSGDRIQHVPGLSPGSRSLHEPAAPGDSWQPRESGEGQAHCPRRGGGMGGALGFLFPGHWETSVPRPPPRRGRKTLSSRRSQRL